jgi:hypothetical protein
MRYLKRYDTYNSLNESGVLLAPNGRPSNLTPNLYNVVRSPEFKAWFGDWENSPESASKVLDENGEPLVCYHGSKSKFSAFDTEHQKIGWLGKGFYFTDDKEATKAYGRVVFQVFLNIRKPFNVKGDDPYSVISEIKDQYDPTVLEKTNDVAVVLKDNDHDGVFFTHWDQGNMITCFYSSQIKFIKDLIK